MADRPYSRVYHEIMDDPAFERVYSNPSALGTWLQMLLTADAMYPTSAPMTSRNPTVRLLIEVGLVIEKPGNRYSIRGLEAERERRSAIGRNAAAVRYQRERSATAVPRRDETSKDKPSNGANAPESTAVVMGFRPRQPKPGSHEGQHPGCIVCHPELVVAHKDGDR
jgi:hypothetical protein